MNGSAARRPRPRRSTLAAPGARSLLALACAALVVLAASGSATADGGTPDAGPSPVTVDARRARVVARVGAATITVGDVEDRLAEIPRFQREMLGPTPDAQVKAYVDQVMIRDLLLAQGAERKKLGATLPTSALLTRARSSATLRALRRALPSPAAIPDEDVKRFYDENRARFEAPERIHLWRVLCKTREEADAVLAAARKDTTTAKWNELAREHSLDKATNLRGGNLGFLGPDGASNEAGLKVDPALVKAAGGVKDGELVAQPVAEGEYFAVVWRRGTVASNRRSLEEASGQIRTTLFRERTESAEKKLVAELRAQKVRDVDPGLLGYIDLGGSDAGLMAPRAVIRPAAAPRTSN